MSTADWHWVNLAGGYAEQRIVDLCNCTAEDTWHSGLSPDGAGLGRGCIVVQTNATASFHVVFSNTGEPSRGTNEPVLRFVVGKRRNSMTSVGFGNPYLKKEPIDFTRDADALLTADPERSRTYWFLYDRIVGVAAMGSLAAPQADLCRLVCRFRDTIGFRAEVCENLRYIAVASGKRPVSLRVLGVGAPPDVSIPRFRFDAAAWRALSWNGLSCVFELDAVHRKLVESVQQLVAKSPIAPFYSFVDPRSFCLNAFRLLDPHRRGELLQTGEDGEHLEWDACYEEVSRRLAHVLRSAPWTYWPLRLERADCTSITLTPAGLGCSSAIQAWVAAVQAAAGLRNGATSRDMFTLTFAFEVFPVQGESAAQVRRDLVREIAAMFQKDWGTMDFRAPFLAAWHTHTDYEPYKGSLVPVETTLPAALPAVSF